jgi:hypothetical protein
MSPFTCTREKEVADLLHRGHWPQACPRELRAHVDACRSCSDLVLVTETFHSAKALTLAKPQLPSGGALWWRAQLRRRNQAIERINKPILGAQIFAFAMTLFVVIAVLAWQLREGHSFAAWFEDLPRALHFDALLPASFPHLEGSLWLLFPLLATVALVSGAVVYLTSEKQ